MNASSGNDENELEPTGGKWICQITAGGAVIGVLGNILVCFVILRVKFLHNMTNYLLVNLAVADLLMCLLIFFFDLTSGGNCALYHIAPTSSGARQLFCRLLVSGYFIWVTSCASGYNLCVVTLERYYAIVHPLQYARKLTATRMKILIALIWIISFLFSIPLVFNTQPSDDPDHTCSEIDYPHRVLSLLIGVFTFLVMYLLPITLTSLAYYKMQIALKRQVKALNLQHARAAAYDLVIARQRLVSMLTIVLGALVILWTPSYVGLLLCLRPTKNGYFLYCGSKGFKYFKAIADLLFYLNSVINPIIYAFKYKKFRQGFKFAWCRHN
ncbi:neuromedin-U receptor 2-like [Patiria miniata]|uniref:G-protein coupled receptors family 1 profile domain-containing protein n=1 Tax=Patiria miniata TaxID=46514 RepID=A0A914B247_PATMI|nr:neuromedin-U receptor 2-like [Patiria miniata]